MEEDDGSQREAAEVLEELQQEQEVLTKDWHKKPAMIDSKGRVARVVAIW